MASCLMLVKGSALKSLPQISRRSICLGNPSLFEQDWRFSQGLPRNPNAYGPLTDNRDFSFVDGKEVPLGVGQKRRIVVNQYLATKILESVKEMDFAVERNARLQQESEDKKNAILGRKFKPKGHLMLKKKTEAN